MSVLLFLVVIPIVGAILTTLLGRRIKFFSDFLACLATSGLLAFSLYLAVVINHQKFVLYKIGNWLPALGICLAADGLSVLLLVIVNLVSFLAMVYSISYMKLYTDKWKFHALFMLMLAGMNGVILSTDLFNLYVFLEMASISGYALVAFGVEDQDIEAAFKYAIMGALASIFILLGIALLYGYTSTLNMADISLVLSTKPVGMLLGFVCVLFLAGFGLKAAIVPFHSWLPDAHASAPASVSAVLSGVFIKALGIYALSRVLFNILGVSDKILSVLLALGLLSMVVGALLAIAQNDIKRMFAYSSISQVGYIVFALGIASPLAIFGALFHLFNHAVFKSLLFFNAGSIEYSTGERRLNKLGGLSSRLPVTSFSGLLGSMSISGVPPFGGFWSKLIIIIAAVEAGYIGFALIAALVSIITLVYYLKFQNLTFFGKLNEAWAGIKEVPATMKFSMIVLTLLCVTSGFLLVPGLRFFLQSAADVLISGTSYKEAFFSAIR